MVKFSSNNHHPNDAAANASMKITSEENIALREPNERVISPCPPTCVKTPRLTKDIHPFKVSGKKEPPAIKATTSKTKQVTQVEPKNNSPLFMVLRPERMAII